MLLQLHTQQREPLTVRQDVGLGLFTRFFSVTETLAARTPRRSPSSSVTPRSVLPGAATEGKRTSPNSALAAVKDLFGKSYPPNNSAIFVCFNSVLMEMHASCYLINNFNIMDSIGNHFFSLDQKTPPRTSWRTGLQQDTHAAPGLGYQHQLHQPQQHWQTD